MEQQKVAARWVDTAEYVGVLRGLVEEGHEVSMLVSGSSMSPFLIHLRDTIYFKKPDRPLRAGDMVFYQRDSGACAAIRSLRSSRASSARAGSSLRATFGGSSLRACGRSSFRCGR